eukprot:4813467-Pyramimonas_sp.AAC.1
MVGKPQRVASRAVVGRRPDRIHEQGAADGNAPETLRAGIAQPPTPLSPLISSAEAARNVRRWPAD